MLGHPPGVCLPGVLQVVAPGAGLQRHATPGHLREQLLGQTGGQLCRALLRLLERVPSLTKQRPRGRLPPYFEPGALSFRSLLGVTQVGLLRMKVQLHDEQVERLSELVPPPSHVHADAGEAQALG